jgi:cyclopropane-fatty-acyl-phospholipid synthase
MAPGPIALNKEITGLTLQLLNELLSGQATRDVGVRLWDGTRWPDETPRPVTLLLKHPGTLRAMFLPGNELGLAEAYLYDDFDIEGDIEAVFDLADALSEATSGWRKKLRAARDLMRLPPGNDHQHGKRGPARLTGKRHSIERDRQAVTYHYDVSNDFYSLWLDRRMVYSCAYFHSPDEDLDTAQERKLDYICRKLRLKAGQRLLDVGCGWGGLVIFAALPRRIACCAPAACFSTTALPAVRPTRRNMAQAFPMPMSFRMAS